MDVILLDKVNNLGNLGDKVRVKNGYARNFLIPKGKAKLATAGNLAEFEARRTEFEKRSTDALITAQSRQKEIEELGSVVISAKVASEGKLFGSVGVIDIVEAITKAGVSIQKREVRLSAGNLRDVGEYNIVLDLHADIETTIRVVITPEE